MEKKVGTIVIHVPKSIEIKFSKLRQVKGFSSNSEYGCYVIESLLKQQQEEFEYMKSIFEAED